MKGCPFTRLGSKNHAADRRLPFSSAPINATTAPLCPSEVLTAAHGQRWRKLGPGLTDAIGLVRDARLDR